MPFNLLHYTYYMISRRTFFIGGALSSLLPARAVAAEAKKIAAPANSADSFSHLWQRAQAALEHHGDTIAHRDTVGLVDYSVHSRLPRFHIIDMASGERETLFVSHGKGSDPQHKGRLQSFSNVPGSEASSAGAYLTGQLYVGKHGRSRRLIGLEERNSNAEARAIVIHGAWYAAPEMVRKSGKLGRSQGCLAVPKADIETVLARLGDGRLIYVDKI